MLTRYAAATRTRITLGLLIAAASLTLLVASTNSTIGRIGTALLFVSGCLQTALAVADHRRRRSVR